MSLELNKEANVFTNDGWQIYENQFIPKHKIISGSNYLLGNGYLGYRGTFAEDQKDAYVACIVTDTFDMADDKWRELCNVPNGLFTKITSEGINYTLEETGFQEYRKELNFKRAILKRTTTFDSKVNLSTEKFASMDNVHLLVMRYQVTASEPTSFTLKTGIDGDVWSLNGNHFKKQSTENIDGLLIAHLQTKEFGTDIYVAEKSTFSIPTQPAIEKTDDSIFRSSFFTLNAGDQLIVEKYVAIYTSNDTNAPRQTAINQVNLAEKNGYNDLKEKHIVQWENLWNDYDIAIEGDLTAQTLTRFNLYHNIIATPRNKIHPIGARGLSCQAYQGAAFWDQEIFNMPMFLYTTPEIAKNILKYRYDTLNGARKKAKDLGYNGAFYAWISGKTGEELCPDFFFKNVLTGRKIRNHFNKWQIHISPDIVYAIKKYYEATNDWNFIENYGAEIAFEVAKFIESRVHYKVDKERYEVIRVLGPDEWHENVDNNTFTNYQCKFALEEALEILHQLQVKNNTKLTQLREALNITDKNISNWRDIAKKMFIHQPREDTQLIPQFDNFFELEDILPEALEERLIDDEEYWGWPNGIAVRTQVSKQADLVQLFAMHDHLFTKDVVASNYYYYEKHCKHGSSLSPAMHAIVASHIGDSEEAFKYFKKASAVDLLNTNEAVVGGTFIGGIHTAAAGAVWQVLVLGFAGVSFEKDRIELSPQLPVTFSKLSFKLQYRNQECNVELMKEELKLSSPSSNTNNMLFTIKNRDIILSPNRVEIVPL